MIEGDVACVGVLGMGPGGMEGFLAKHQTRLKDIDLGSGRSIKIKNRYLSDSEEDENTVRKAVEELKAEGAQVLVASDAYGVDDIAGEQFVFEIAHDEMGMETTVASDITKLYGLTRRTRTTTGFCFWELKKSITNSIRRKALFWKNVWKKRASRVSMKQWLTACWQVASVSVP